MSRRRWIRIATTLVVLLALSGATLAVGAASGIFQGFPVVVVKVNGRSVEGDVPAVKFYGRTMVPLRLGGEAFGAQVTWDEATLTASICSKAVGGEQEGMASASVASFDLVLEAAPRCRSPCSVGR